jgi:hypothetical protein
MPLRFVGGAGTVVVSTGIASDKDEVRTPALLQRR